MALLFMDGFDASDYNLGKYNTAGGALSVSAATRYGTGLALTAVTSGQGVRKDFAAVAKVFVGVAYKAVTFSDSNNVFILAGDAGGTNHITVRVMVGGAVALYRGATQVAISAAGVCVPNTWHYLELSATVSDTVGVTTARVDGVQVCTFTGDTKNAGTASTIDAVSCNTSAGGGQWFDDLYIADGTGPAPRNDFLGECRVQMLKVNGPGAVTQLTPVGSGTNWQNVDETPPSATDYNWSGTVGHQDLYTLEDLTAGTAAVYGLQFVSYAQKTDAATRSIRNLIRTGGATYQGTPRALTTTPTATLTVSNVHPAAGAEWTLADVNALETGIEVA